MPVLFLDTSRLARIATYSAYSVLSFYVRQLRFQRRQLHAHRDYARESDHCWVRLEHRHLTHFTVSLKSELWLWINLCAMVGTPSRLPPALGTFLCCYLKIIQRTHVS